MRYSRGYPSWTKNGHELALVPINPVVRRRIIDLPIFRRRAKPTANDLYVAMGAAVQEAAPPRAEVPTVLVDITPYAFGTSAVSDLEGEPYPYCYVPIIKKNTPIPVCKSKAFRAIRDDLDIVDVKIVRGKKLTRSKISSSVNSASRGSGFAAGNPIIVDLKLDRDGILYVAAREKNTGLERRIRMDDAVQRYTPGKDGGRECVCASARG